MSPRSAVGEITQTVAFDIPEAERQALATDVQSQLATLPTSIPDLETYRRVVESLPLLKRAEDKVVAFFKDMKAAAYEVHKRITTKEAEQLKPITQARARLSQLKYAFEQEQDRRRRAEELRVSDEQRLAQQAAALEEAAALETAGAPEMAAQIIEQAIAAPAPVVVLPSATAAVVSDVRGVGKSKPRWVWRFAGAPDHETPWKKLTPLQRQHLMQLLPREYLMPDDSAITAMVNGMSGNVKIPGIEIYDIGSTPVRG